ncbi:MAG: hypothetical protein J4G12_06585 [Gemmatimonadetes bacterium]|nr:hypothetical protein [Gemmatimonadota bacterium]
MNEPRSEAERSRLSNSRIAEMVRRVVGGGSAHIDWRPAHSGLLNELRASADEAVVAEISPVAKDLAEARNWSVTANAVSDKAMLDAKNTLNVLKNRAHRLHGDPLPSQRDVESPSGIRWLVLLTLVAFFVMVEAGFNVTLLISALDSGLVGAFITAILASAVNVGFGAGSGMGISFLVKRFGIPKAISGACFAVVGGVAVLINLIVGRHRESFERLIEQREQAGGLDTQVTLTSARQLAVDIPMNPTTWELRSFLFFVLGVVLFGVGLYKGYTFVKSKLPAVKEKRLQEIHAIRDDFDGVSKRHRRALEDEMKRAVTDVVVRLDSARHVSRHRLMDLAAAWNQGGSVAYAESLFLKEFNDRHPDKITREMLDSHRKEPGVTPTELRIDRALATLDDADGFMEAWSSGEGVKFAKIQTGVADKINRTWMDYQSVILIPLEDLTDRLGLDPDEDGRS